MNTENASVKVIFPWCSSIRGVGPDDLTHKINLMRARIIRLCRQELGQRFLGGFIDTPIARSNYPDAVLKGTISHREYIQTVKNAQINIYTQGLNNCISWKLMEYLAAGTAVVGERISNVLPPGEIDSGFFFAFDTADECLAHIESLLGNKSALTSAKELAYRHYINHLAPEQKLARILFSELYSA
jgi:hypothetical protein